MLGFIKNLHNRRPLLWTVIAFVIVVATATTMSIWWNYLLVQNDRILREMTKAATTDSNFPLAILMVLGILCSLVIVSGLLYLFLRLIRAVQLNIAQSQFIAAVTHELRSPVASLQIMLETIRDPSTPPERRAEFERCMDVDLKRLRTLVDQVLDTARLEHLFSPPSREPVPIAHLLHDCAQALEPRLKTTASTLRVEDVPAGLAAVADRRLLMTALLNIIDNALKYSHGPAQIAVRVFERGEKIAIEVEDKGIGISRKELGRVFKRFYRSGDPMTQGRPGTGLGLYFARLAVRAQGGDVNVQSAGLGMGSTFRVEIPKQ